MVYIPESLRQKGPPAVNPLSAKLHAAYARAAKLRRAAFVSFEDRICGVRVNPVTLGTHNAMLAFENGFVSDGKAPGPADIADFLWIHDARRRGQLTDAGRRQMRRRVARWLHPIGYQVNDWLRLASRDMAPGLAGPVFRLTRPSAIERFRAASALIIGLLVEAMHDYPPGDDSAEPLPFAVQANIYNSMRRNLGMSYAETDALPLRQLTQFVRESIHHVSHGKAMLMTAEEAAILAEDLKIKTEAAQVSERARK